MTDPFTAGVIAKNKRLDAKKAERAAMQDRERAVWMATNQDWNPEYASDHVGTYQRSRSPVADGFLESFLTGENPAAVQGTRNQAPQMKAQAQQRFDKSYGGWDELRRQQREMEASTPWETTPITRRVSQPRDSEHDWRASRAGGMDGDELKQLERDGFKFNNLGEFRNKSSGKTAQGAMIQATGHEQGSADSAEGRAYMRGLARARAEGLSLDDAIALGRDALIKRGG